MKRTLHCIGNGGFSCFSYDILHPLHGFTIVQGRGRGHELRVYNFPIFFLNIVHAIVKNYKPFCVTISTWRVVLWVVFIVGGI